MKPIVAYFDWTGLLLSAALFFAGNKFPAVGGCMSTHRDTHEIMRFYACGINAVYKQRDHLSDTVLMRYRYLIGGF